VANATNKFTLNMRKTAFLLIGSRQRLSNLSVFANIKINQFPVKHVLTTKSLGVHIDENLTWECHINELSKKLLLVLVSLNVFTILSHLGLYLALITPSSPTCY